VAKALEVRYGKRDWPAEARAELAKTRRAELMALPALHEVKVEQKDIDESVQRVAEALRVVTTAHVLSTAEP
jgi:hypothetical protein